MSEPRFSSPGAPAAQGPGSILPLAVTAAFLAAIVVAGLALSLVPNVELVTLTAFAAGIVLGTARGAFVGGAGMVLYVFANSALRGFAPSPLPVLAAQALGLAGAGFAGGLWKRFWLRGGRPRRGALRWLPFLGAGLATWMQILLNGVWAWLGAGEGTAFLGLFWSGFTFGAVQILANAIVFALAGPAVAHVLWRAGKSRGWWVGAVAMVAALATGPAAAEATEAPLDSLAAGSAGSGGSADSSTVPVQDLSEASPADSVVAPPPGSGLRPLRLTPDPLWREVRVTGADRDGRSRFLDIRPVPGLVQARSVSDALSGTVDRWALGWGRTRISYDGVPLGGNVHSAGEPPDVPLAWRAPWREKWTGGTLALDLAAPPPAPDRALSQASLTSGSFGRRTTEFALFRNLGPINAGVDYMDREQDGDLFFGSPVTELDGDRLWLRLESVPGRRPDWSLDVANGASEHRLSDGGTFSRNTRRALGTLSGPLLGGETRIALHLRREALRVRPVGSRLDELRFDGATLQGDWTPPGPAGLRLFVRWDHERRRGILEETGTFDGARAGAAWGAVRGPWRAGLDLVAGHQEPYGATWEGTALVAREWPGFRLTAAVSREEGLPPMVLFIDRATPDAGLGGHLSRIEEAEDPERVTALRVEGEWTRGGWVLAGGGWIARQTGYLAASNPLWTPTESGYAPVDPIPSEATVRGFHGEVRVPLVAGFFGSGAARVHDRNLEEVPYLPRWNASGDLHWRRLWFNETLDLDAAIGGEVVGPRRNPAGEEYGSAAIGHVRVAARVDNGYLGFSVENLADAFVEADFRLTDFTTPALIPGRHFVLALTMYLLD